MKKIFPIILALVLYTTAHANITLTVDDTDTFRYSSASSAGPTFKWQNNYGLNSEGSYFYYDNAGTISDDTLIHTIFHRGRNSSGVVTNVVEQWSKILVVNDGDEAGFYEIEGLVNSNPEILASFIYFYGDMSKKGHAETIFNQEGAKMNVSIKGEAGVSIIETIASRDTIVYKTDNSITASSTIAQGEVPLVDIINNVAGVPVAGGAVTLPPAQGGDRRVVFNNGQGTLRIYPVSGDNIGLGTNSPYLLVSKDNMEFIAYDTTKWEAMQ